jgi:hypothetical protein
MKQLITFTFILLFSVLFSAEASAQLFPNRETRDLRKEVKRLKSEGWIPFTGALPIETQFIKKQAYATGEYLIGRGSAFSKLPSAGRDHAYHKALDEIVKNMQSDVYGVVKKLGNTEEYSETDNISLKKLVDASLTEFGQEISGLIIVFQTYRKMPSGNYECAIELAVDKNAAMNAAAAKVKKRLQEEAAALYEKHFGDRKAGTK